MSNKEEKNVSLLFLWNQISVIRKIALIFIFFLSITFSFGLGILSDKESRAPIVIEQCAE